MLEGIDELRQRPSALVVLVLCAVVVVAHQAMRWDWFIDDAAICFAYARNIALGEGIVPWPGGERVEAISDPTWVALLAALYAVGLDGFTVAKPLAMLFGIATAFVTWRLARRGMPEHEGSGALIAPIALAFNAQFAIWSASGLENGLFCLVLALALYATVVEAQGGGRPWSAIAYLILAWTRPEGMLYAALGGAWFAIWTLQGGRGLRPIGRWLAVFWIPTLALEAARWWYFAWPYPNTYYAKIDNRGVAPLDWGARGWGQLRAWSGRLWHGFFVPVYLVGITGPRGTRLIVGGGAVGILLLSVLWPGPDKLAAIWLWPELPDPPQAFVWARVIGLIGAGFALPLLALGGIGGRVRVLCGQTLALGLLFSVVANGDWMGGYRFMSLVAVPGSVLLAIGITALADVVEHATSGRRAWGPAGWMVASVLVGLLLPPNLSQTRDHVTFNTNETTASVKQRVDVTRDVARRTFYTGPIVNLEVDQGAHLWWAPDYTAVDMAMLVDIPMSRHWYQQRAFIEEYVYQEQQPTFAHVGGWWAGHTGLRRYADWSDTYFELPPYIDMRFDGPFPNVFARRDLVMIPATEAALPDPIPVAGGVSLFSPLAPAPWAPGARGYVEVPIALGDPGAGPVQMVLFLSDASGVVASWDLALGYGIYPQAWWRPGEVFRGRHAVPLPAAIPPGHYDLGVLFLDAAGAVSPARNGASDPRFARGEVRFADRVEVVAPEELVHAIDRARQRIADLADAGDCVAAEGAQVVFDRHRPVEWGWHAEEAVRTHRWLADCWARRAEVDADGAADHLARAHRWDHHSAALARVGGPVGQALYARGRRARADEDWQTAYDSFADLLTFQPWRSWARRWAEEARDHRLGLTDDVRIGIGGEDDLRRVEEAATSP